MEGARGGSSTPSYKDAVAGKGKTPIISNKSFVNGRNRDKEKETDGNKTMENSSTKDKEEEDKSHGARDKKQKGPCKPIAEIIPRIILNDPAL